MREHLSIKFMADREEALGWLVSRMVIGHGDVKRRQDEGCLCTNIISDIAGNKKGETA